MEYYLEYCWNIIWNIVAILLEHYLFYMEYYFKKECNIDTCYNMNELSKHYVKQKSLS